MFRILLILLISLITLPTLGQSASTVLVRTENNAAGTGVVVSPAHVLTANHVVADDSRIRIESGSIMIGAKVERRDELNDLALLKLDQEIDLPVIVVRHQPLSLSEQVRLLGHARAQWTLTEKVGRVAGIQSKNGVVAYIRISTPVVGGMSGGPVVDSEGRLVAIIVAVTLEDSVPTNALASPNHAVVKILSEKR